MRTFKPAWTHIDEMLGDLFGGCDAGGLVQAVRRMILPGFFDAPASWNHHHAFIGGLAAHTAEVVSHAVQAAGEDDLVLIAAAAVHDACKVHEYTIPGYRHTIGHIRGGAALWLEVASRSGVDPATVSEVAHMILSHHGPHPEWGSPVEPLTRRALILHHADMVSSRYPVDATEDDRAAMQAAIEPFCHYSIQLAR